MTEAQKDIDAIIGNMEKLFIEHGRTIHLDDPEMHAHLVAANYLLSSTMPLGGLNGKFDGEIHD